MTDLNMPHMDGIELAKKVKAENLNLNYKIILISAED